MGEELSLSIFVTWGIRKSWERSCRCVSLSEAFRSENLLIRKYEESTKAHNSRRNKQIVVY